MGGTWDLDPDDFLLWVFFLDLCFNMWIGPCGPVTPPRLEWTSFPPLVTAVLITPKGAESPDSRRTRSNMCAGSYPSIRDRLGQTLLSLAGPVAH